MMVSVQRALGFPSRGMLTIWMGHLLLGMAYATVVIQARLILFVAAPGLVRAIYRIKTTGEEGPTFTASWGN